MSEETTRRGVPSGAPEEAPESAGGFENPPLQAVPLPPAPAMSPEEIAALNERVASLTAENATAAQITAQHKADLIALQGSHDSAVTAYRELIIKSNPLFTPDLIQGATIQELEVAAKKVNDLAAHVRAKIEADIKSVIIPAGAPERSGPDTSGLTAREKIYHAVTEGKNKP